MKTEKQIQGKKNRQKGALFERQVRDKLIASGWFVIKNPNNVIVEETQGGQHISFKQAKSKFNPFTKRPMMIGAGFPDFIAYELARYQYPILDIEGKESRGHLYSIIGIECKTNGYLSKDEKERCQWLLRKNIFSKIYVTSKSKEKRGKIVFKEITSQKEAI